jgi:hypothetical protein
MAVDFSVGIEKIDPFDDNFREPVGSRVLLLFQRTRARCRSTGDFSRDRSRL